MYYGWYVLLAAAAAMVGTLPGRTQGLGLVTEALLSDLGIGRVAYAELNLWATLIGSAGALGVGQLMDRFGSRAVLTTVALLLGAVVIAMSQATSIAALAVWITLTRALGQSALSVVSLAMIAPWFVRRIETAMAIYSVTMSVGFMIAFPVVGSLVQQRGWRVAWLSIGLALVAGLAPLSWALVRPSPATIGLEPDALRTQHSAPAKATAGRPSAPSSSRGAPGTGHMALGTDGFTLAEALGEPSFWIFALGTALYGLVASGIGLFNESILAQRGFGPDVYYQTLVVTAMTALVGNFAGGWMATRIPLTRLMGTSLLVLTGGLVALPHLTTLPEVWLWAVAMGLGGGLVMVLFFAVWPRVFGRRHIGRIQGAAQALTVVFSAVGPLLLAWCVEWTGSYAWMFRMLAAVIGLLALVSFATKVPAPVRASAAA